MAFTWTTGIHVRAILLLVLNMCLALSLPSQSRASEKLNALPDAAYPVSVDETLVQSKVWRIVGGQIADIKDYPYQLSFQLDGQHVCGAVIISNDWAVTAAHCVAGIPQSTTQIRAGSSFHASGGTLHSVTQVQYHPQYSNVTRDFDIAVFKVSPQFTYSTVVQPIGLQEATVSTGTLAVVSGWGFTYDGENANSNQLRQVSVPIITNAECLVDYPNQITARMICAGLTDGGKDACQNDSGGPLAVSNRVVGIVSWGESCGAPDFPGVYSNVAVLRDWIRSTTGV